MSTAEKITLVVNRSADRKPLPFRLVLVAGGVAIWNGERWLTQTGDDSGRQIEWDVPWWMEIPELELPIAAEIAAEAKERDEREAALLATLKSIEPVLKATSPRIWAAVRNVVNKAEKEMAAATAQGE